MPVARSACSRQNPTRRPATSSAVVARPGTNAIRPPKSLPHAVQLSSSAAVSVITSTAATAARRPSRGSSQCATPADASNVEVASTAKAMLPMP